MKIKRKNLEDLDDEQYYTIDFHFNYQNDEALIDYYIDGGCGPNLDILQDCSDYDFDGNFADQQYYYYTRDKSKFEQFENEMINMVYMKIEQFINDIDSVTKPYKDYLNKTPYRRTKKLERICQ